MHKLTMYHEVWCNIWKEVFSHHQLTETQALAEYEIWSNTLDAVLDVYTNHEYLVRKSAEERAFELKTQEQPR